MRKIVIIGLSIISLLSTACSAATDSVSGTAAGQSQEQPQKQTPPDLAPADNCFGFPPELVNDLRYRMLQGDADVCIDYLDQLDDRDYRITSEEFFSLLDMTDETTAYMMDQDEAEDTFFRCDTDGDGTDELIAFHKDHQGSVSAIYMLVEGEAGYIYFGGDYVDNIRLFTIVQYEDAFYYAASCDDEYTDTVNLQVFMLDRNIFRMGNHTDSICFNRMLGIAEPHLIYSNENHPDIRYVEAYLSDIIYDIIYANRLGNTIHGDKWTVRNKVWEDEHYRLADMWFKELNGKEITFTLYQEIETGQQYLFDARIQENGETTILMDYMVVLETTDIQVTEFDGNAGISIYKPLIYQDPALSSAFPGNLSDIAELSLLKVRGYPLSIKNNSPGIPDDLTEILAEMMTDKVFDDPEGSLGMDKYLTNDADFYSRYGAYIQQAEMTLEDGGTQSIYQITLGSTDYFLLLQCTEKGKMGDLHIYRRDAGRLIYVSTYNPGDYWGKVIEHADKLYIVRRPIPWFPYPRYLDTMHIRQLIPEGEQAAVVEGSIETFQWQKLYDNLEGYGPAVADYLENIKTELMEQSYRLQDEEIYSGDEDPDIDPDKQLRLGLVTTPDKTFSKVDFNNDQTDEYITKYKNHGRIFAGIYQFTDKGIIRLEYDPTEDESWEGPIQLWFKEIDGKVFTFRLFYIDEAYYLLNVSLIEGTNITQIQTHIIVPKVNYSMSEIQ